ncbi:MAG: ribbon-helix-helix protein, CopG family [Candidatus Binataceae bacterium]|jgi:predicted transcriptional regulator
MKRRTIAVRLDDDLKSLLDLICRKSGRTSSEVVRDALRRYLACARFEELRRRIIPFAEARGILTDENVFKTLS